jgi:hypothetical protein
MTSELIPYSGTSLNRFSKKYVGQVFGKVTISELAGRKGSNKSSRLMVKILCECGGSKIVDVNDIVRGHTKSCGCLSFGHNPNKQGRFKYGKSVVGEPENKAWIHAKYMANKNGLHICERWTDDMNGYGNFLEDMGRRPNETCMLRRIYSQAGYSRDNCYWYQPHQSKTSRTDYFGLEVDMALD